MRPRPQLDAEADLLVAYREGDGRAFRLLVDAYRDRMVQFFYRLCWDRDRAEDLAQDLFVKLMLGSRRYRPEGKLSTYVYRVATNLWIDHYRSRRPQPAVHSYDQASAADAGETRTEYAGTAPSPVDEAADEEERAKLRRCLDQLTEPHRLVFELAVYQERPYAEVAELLGIPVGTVKSRMHNAVHTLKQLLGPAAQVPAAGRAAAAPVAQPAAEPAAAPIHPFRRAVGGP